MGNIYIALVRHAEYRQKKDVPSAHQPYELTPQGQLQAEKAGQLIADMVEQQGWSIFPEVDSSTLLRAWQTARIITDCLSQRFAQTPVINSCSALTERSMGSAANLTIEEIEDVLRVDPRFGMPPSGWKADSHYCLPLEGAESLWQAGERVANHLNKRVEALELDKENSTDYLRIFVGHGAALRHAACHLGVLSIDMMPKLSMYHADPIYLQYIPRKGWRHVAGHWKQRELKEVNFD